MTETKIHALEYLQLDDPIIEVSKKTLASKLLKDLYQLFFNKDLCVFGISVIEYFLSTPRICSSNIDICIPDEREIPIIIKKLANVLSFSYDIHVKLLGERKNISDSDDESHDPECTCGHSNDMNNIIMGQMDLHYRYVKGVCFHINIHKGPLDEMDFVFDFDAIYALNMETISVNNFCSNYTLADAVKAANEKKFRVIGKQRAPDIDRLDMGIMENTRGLMRYLELSQKTADLLNCGWKIIGPRLDKVFYPCLIGKSPENSKCSICNDDFKKYELKLDCCSQFICFECSLKYVSSRAHNSEIPCPLCKGDPFGWNTC